ncbi:MAG: DNA polymerase III subunit beta [Prevotella sp.]|nr:DNA polymerase III subunit beta [Prevotella sp.]
MRFVVSSSDLNNQLQTLSKVIASKNVFAILDCFLFEIADGKIKITASDKENTMSTTIAIEDAFVSGSFAIPNRTLLEAMKELPDQPLTFDVNTEEMTVKVLYQNGMYNFTAWNANEFPTPQAVGDNASVISVNAAVLANNIARSIYATAQDEIRPVMNGIFFDLNATGLSIVASDGHKLVRNTNFTVKSDTPTSFILPKKPAALLKNVLTHDGGDVVIKFDERCAEITYDEGTLNCRLIEGRYPNYNSIIPQNNPNQLIIDRKILLSALRRVIPFANGTQLVRFHLEPGKLVLNSEDIDFATSAQENIACNYTGAAMNIGFKGGSFTEILANIDSEEVIIELADPIRAGVIKPVVQPADEENLVLIMPILLND